MQRVYDALIVGGGHNGLVASAYLASRGLQVLVLERRPLVGGASVTELPCAGSTCAAPARTPVAA